MKQSARFFLLVSIVIIFIACSSTPAEKLLTGKWVMEKMVSGNDFGMNDSLVTAIEQNSSIEFDGKNIYTQTILGVKGTGTYKINKEGNLITFKSDLNNEMYVDTIIELTKTKFVLAEQIGSRKIFKK